MNTLFLAVFVLFASFSEGTLYWTTSAYTDSSCQSDPYAVYFMEEGFCFVDGCESDTNGNCLNNTYYKYVCTSTGFTGYDCGTDATCSSQNCVVDTQATFGCSGFTGASYSTNCTDISEFPDFAGYASQKDYITSDCSGTPVGVAFTKLNYCQSPTDGPEMLTCDDFGTASMLNCTDPSGGCSSSTCSSYPLPTTCTDAEDGTYLTAACVPGSGARLYATAGLFIALVALLLLW